MRELTLNGYIDDEVWWGDEITPDALHGMLYGAKNEYADDVHIRLNSYGGSCNAAVRMHDDIRLYPGNVKVTVSGTAASAATVLATAADRLEMTPGSLWMIHDPVVLSWGNERDLNEALNLLRACKESILNVYGGRSQKPRELVAEMIAASTWMDARQALADGFIDGITDVELAGPTNSAPDLLVVDRKDAERKVKAWLERRMKPASVLYVPTKSGITISSLTPNMIIQSPVPDRKDESPPPPAPVEPELAPVEPEPTPDEPKPEPIDPGTPIAQLETRLGLLLPGRR